MQKQIWESSCILLIQLKETLKGIPHSPVVRSLSRGHRFDLWLGNKDLASHAVKPKISFLVKNTHRPKSGEPELQR